MKNYKNVDADEAVCDFLKRIKPFESECESPHLPSAQVMKAVVKQAHICLAGLQMKRCMRMISAGLKS